MRPTIRLAGAAGVCVLLLAGSLTLAGAASAIPVDPTLTGAAPALAHGPGTVRFTYTIDVVGVDVDATVFTTHQDVELPVAASTSDVTLDGVAVPTGQISQTGVSDITVQVGADPADGLVVGTHTIGFNATLGTTTAATQSTASLAWTRSSVPGAASSSPVPVAVNQIDISTILTPDSGEDQVGFLGTGNDVYFEVDVSNVGYGTPDTQLVVDVGVGLALGPDGVMRDENDSLLPCAPAVGNPQQLVCDVGTLAHATANDDPTINIDLIPTADAVVGQTATVTATSSPQTGQGTDSNAANNAASAQLKFTGAAALTSTITPAKKKVELGASTTVKLTVRNAGPQPTGQTVAFSIVAGDNFTVTHFSGNTTPPPDLGGPQSGEDTPTNVVIWFAGDIAAGHSVSATLTLTLKATKLGSARIGLFTSSEAGDPNCTQFNCEPTEITMQVIAVPPAVVSPPATTPTSASGLTLASTGSASGPELGIAALLLLVGALLLSLGTRRRICGGLPIR